MHQIEIKYKGNLRTHAVHLQSGKSIVTDAPTDNKGRGEAFSPTDIVASALGSCILTIIGIVAERHGLNVEGMRCEVSKIMSENPRKISNIIIHIFFPITLSSKNQKTLEKTAYSCPVHQSLHVDIEIEIVFHYPIYNV